MESSKSFLNGFFSRTENTEPQLSEMPVKAEPEQPERKYKSDIDAFLAARNQLARQRNERFQQRINSLRGFQNKAEEILERIRTNPITLLALSEIEKGQDAALVVRNVSQRRQDSFSSDAGSINTDLREFDNAVTCYVRMAYLSLEASMEAPLPELGRPAALQKSLWIFLRHICSCDALKIYLCEDGKTFHQKLQELSDSIIQVCTSAKKKLDTLYADIEQPMKIEPLFTPPEEQGDKPQPVSENTAVCDGAVKAREENVDAVAAAS